MTKENLDGLVTIIIIIIIVIILYCKNFNAIIEEP
jgi:hypothetical protein